MIKVNALNKQSYIKEKILFV